MEFVKYDELASGDDTNMYSPLPLDVTRSGRNSKLPEWNESVRPAMAPKARQFKVEPLFVLYANR